MLGTMLGSRLRRYLITLVIGVLALIAVPAAGFGQADRLQNLEPGGRADLDEKVPVNFVFVGYDRDDVDADAFLAGLPDRYRPVRTTAGTGPTTSARSATRTTP